MTVPSEGGYDPEVHLNMGDVAVDDPRERTLIQLRIKQPKTDPFRLGVKVAWRRRRPKKGWGTPSLRLWGGGRVWRISSMCRSRQSS